MNQLQTFRHQEWYLSLIEECEAIIVEKEFESRISLVEGYHQLGTRILQDIDKFNLPTEQVIDEIALTVKKSRRTIMYALKFAKIIPNLSELTEGKNISWSKIIRERLTEKGEEEALPALPLPKTLKDVVVNNLDFLIDNLKQSKNGITMFLPYDKIDYEILQKDNLRR
jgi:hypothetical protein